MFHKFGFLKVAFVLALTLAAVFHNTDATKLKKALKNGLLLHAAVQMMTPKSPTVMPIMMMPMMPMEKPMKFPCPEIVPEIIDISELLHDHHHHHHDIHFDVVTDNSMMKKPMMKPSTMSQMMPPAMPSAMPPMKMKMQPPMQPPMELPEMEDDTPAIPMPPPVRYESKPVPLRLNGGYRGVNPRMVRGTPIRNRL